MGQCPENCPLKGICGGDAPELATKLLFVMLGEAHAAYLRDVSGCGKLYSRFVTDFLNGHRYTDAMCAAGKNAHNTATGIVSDLFNIRPDLARDYLAKPGFSHADAEEMIAELNTGKPDPAEVAAEDRPRFIASMSPRQTEALAALAVRTRIFKGEISAEDMAALFDCRPARPLKSANNRRVAVFFDELADARLIERDWQKVIAANGLILSSASNAPLSRSALSSALAEARTENSAAVATIRKGVRQVADTAEKG